MHGRRARVKRGIIKGYNRVKRVRREKSLQVVVFIAFGRLLVGVKTRYLTAKITLK